MPSFRASRSALVAFAVAVLVGHITDQTTGQPLAGVVVHAGAAHAKTNADGAYTLTGVKPGQVAVTLESDDVPPQQFTVRIGRGTTKHDFIACSITLDYRCATTP